MHRALALVLLALAAAVACSKMTPSEIERAHIEKSKTSTSPAPPQALAVIGGVQGPESVLYDPDQDAYFISNINGGELAADGNGFISRVDAGTLAVTLKWIEGGRNGVHLDGPKGMGIAGDVLYVSDVAAVRKFDRRTGAPLGEIALPGATFINDIASDGNRIFVSDTGLAMGAGQTFKNTGTEAVWLIDGDHARKIASGPDLKEPNGLDVVDGKLWVVSFGANQLYALEDGRKTNVAELPKGELDGLAHMPNGSTLISSWEGNAIYRGPAGGPFQAVLEAIDSPADICYDPRHHRLLVPHSAANEVTVHPLQ